jgi:hypothetical protein
MIDELPFTIVRSNGTGEVSDRVPPAGERSAPAALPASTVPGLR